LVNKKARPGEGQSIGEGAETKKIGESRKDWYKVGGRKKKWGEKILRGPKIEERGE